MQLRFPWGFLALVLLLPCLIEGAGFTIRGSTLTLANSAQLSTTSDLVISSGALVANLSQVLIGGNWTNAAGSFAAGTSTVTFNAITTGKTITTKGSPFNNVYFNGSGGYWTLQDSMTVVSTATFATGTFDTNSATSLGVMIMGNWLSNGGTLALNNSTITFAGAGTSTSTLRGSTTFYSLTSIIPGKTIMMEVNSTQTVTNLFTLTGASGNPIYVNSTHAGSLGYLNNSGFNSVSFVNAKDNNANAGITISAGATSSNAGNTFNWLFGAQTLSVTLSPKPYDFTTVNLAATTVSTSATGVTNSGNVTETYLLSVATTGVQTVWGVGTTPPTSNDTFVLYGVFNSTQPSPSDFRLQDVLISTPAAASGTVFSMHDTGYRTAIGSTKNLWFRLDMPLTTSTTVQQLMTLTVTAGYP